MSNGDQIRAGHAIADGLSSLFRPPFRLLVVVVVLIPLAGDSIAGRDGILAQDDLWLVLALSAASLFVQIAATLAAGRTDPDPSTDMWLRAAWRRRCFWRLTGTVLVSLAILAGGLALAGIGIFVVGAVIAFAQVAAVLERRGPFGAIARSVVLTRGNRWQVGLVYAALFIVPTFAVYVADLVELRPVLGPLWSVISVLVEVLGLAGVIALTRMFVTVGGDPTPAVMEPARTGATSG
jgi:hypothetical protein